MDLLPALRNPVKWTALRGPALDALRRDEIWRLHLGDIRRRREDLGLETVQMLPYEPPPEGSIRVWDGTTVDRAEFRRVVERTGGRVLQRSLVPGADPGVLDAEETAALEAVAREEAFRLRRSGSLLDDVPVAFLQAVAYVEAMGVEAYDRMLETTDATARAVEDLAAVTRGRRRWRQEWERTFGLRAEGGSLPAPPPLLSTRQWKRSPALVFLHARLRDGRPRRATRLIAEAERLGISRRTLKRAKRELGVVTYRGAPGRPVRWCLPRR